MPPATAGSPALTGGEPAGPVPPAPAAREPSPGVRQATEIRDQLRALDPMVKSEIHLLATSPASMTYLVEHTSLLRRAAEGDTQAAREIIEHLPEGSSLRSMLNLSGIAALLGQGESVEQELRAQLLANAQSLREAADRLESAEVRFAVRLIGKIPIRLDRVLRDFEAGRISPTLVGHLIDGAPTANDVITLFRYLRDQGGGTFEIDMQQPEIQEAIARLGIPSHVHIENVERVILGPGDRITFRMKNELLVDAGPLSVNVGRELTAHLSILLDPKNSSLTAKMSPGKAFGMVFVGLRLQLTGVRWLDVLLDVLIKIILSPLLLIVAIVAAATGGASINLRDDEHGTRATARVLGIKVVDRRIAET